MPGRTGEPLVFPSASAVLGRCSSSNAPIFGGSGQESLANLCGVTRLCNRPTGGDAATAGEGEAGTDPDTVEPAAEPESGF